MPNHQQLQPENSTDAHSEINTTNPDNNSDSNFGPLGRSILQSLPVGVVAFDSDLKIIETNRQAAELIELNDYIDKSLAKAKGTDSIGASGLDWSKRLKSAISTGKTFSFDNINYVLNGKTKLLRIVCTPFKTTNTAVGIIILEDITERSIFKDN